MALSLSGRSAHLFIPSEQSLPMHGWPLIDTGDGFDWRAWEATQSLWLEPLKFRGSQGPLEPLKVWPLGGRVGFQSCQRGGRLRVFGSCLPLSSAGSAGAWSLTVDGQENGVARCDEVTLTDWRADRLLASAERCFLRLPYTNGAYAAFGRLSADSLAIIRAGVQTEPLTVVFEKGEVEHVRT